MVNRFGAGEVYSAKFTSLQFDVRGSRFGRLWLERAYGFAVKI